MSFPPLDGKVALVTGAGSIGVRGLSMGPIMARELHRAGAAVAALDINASALDRVAAQIGGGRFITVAADISSPEDCAAAVETVTRQLGAPDILVNHAGVGQSTTHPGGQHGKQFRFWELDLAAWQRLQRVNAMGPFFLARLVVQAMIAKGWGRIINTATSFETMLDPFRAAYGPSKAALESSSAIWAKELEGTGVTVNCLLPGGMVASNSPGTQGVPADKLLSPEMMGPPIRWLASAASDGITGRRFVARSWKAEAPAEQQYPIGWPGIGPGRTRPPAGY